MTMTMQTKEIIEFKLQPALAGQVLLNLSRLVAHVPMLELAHDQLAKAAQQRISNALSACSPLNRSTISY